jgi:hypothetical protein
MDGKVCLGAEQGSRAQDWTFDAQKTLRREAEQVCGERPVGKPTADHCPILGVFPEHPELEIDAPSRRTADLVWEVGLLERETVNKEDWFNSGPV